MEKVVASFQSLSFLPPVTSNSDITSVTMSTTTTTTCAVSPSVPRHHGKASITPSSPPASNILTPCLNYSVALPSVSTQETVAITANSPGTTIISPQVAISTPPVLFSSPDIPISTTEISLSPSKETPSLANVSTSEFLLTTVAPTSKTSTSPSVTPSSSNNVNSVVIESPPLAESSTHVRSLEEDSFPSSSPITDISTSEKSDFFCVFLDEMIKNPRKVSENSPSIQTIPSTSVLMNDDVINPDVLKSLLDHLLDNCKKLALLYADIDKRVEDEFDNLRSDINSSMDDLTKQFDEQFNDLKNHQQHLSEKLNTNSQSDIPTDESMADLHSKLFELDCRILECEQYPRRENIIISGIPSSVNHSRLKESVIDICSTLGLDLDENDISACHRLGKKRDSRWPANVIVRFVNRGSVDFLMEKRDRLKDRAIRNQLDMNLRFFENLAPKNGESLRIGKWLLEEELIESYFIRNGFLKIVVNEGDDPIRIRHPDELRKKFYDITFPF